MDDLEIDLDAATRAVVVGTQVGGAKNPVVGSGSVGKC